MHKVFELDNKVVEIADGALKLIQIIRERATTIEAKQLADFSKECASNMNSIKNNRFAVKKC